MESDAKLQEGVRYGDSNLVENSLEDGADPNSIGLYGWSAMHEAASNGDVEILELLLQFKGDPNGRDELEGCTPVHYAAREGHEECLRALLKAGGRYDVENNNGSTALDDAGDQCKHILDKEKTRDFLNMTLDTARNTISNLHQTQTPSREPKAHSSETITPDQPDGHQENVGRITPRAWNSSKLLETKKTSGHETLSGSLQLSFEYNSKAKTFKIRVWCLQDILLPPAEFSNLSRIYVKSHLLPDKKGGSKRKTDEIRIDDPTKLDNSLVTLRRKGTRDSFKAVFLPSTFKFSKALEYQNISKEEVDGKTVHIAVCVRQRYSTRTIPIASIQLPMKEAVRKLIKEKYALHSCINYSMPDNIHAYDPHDIVVISEGMYSNRTTSHPTLRTKSRQTLIVDEDNVRASSDINLQAMRCHSVESVPSTVVDVQTGPKETSLDDLLEVSVEGDKSAIFDPNREGVTVVEVHEHPSPPETPLPGFTEEGELTDVSIISPRQSPDSTTIDLGGVETIDLDSEALASVRSSTPTTSRHSHVKHGFENPHITIVDDDDIPDVYVDKGDARWTHDNKDAVINIGHSDHRETKKKGFKGHLFKKKHKRGKRDGMDNPGYVVDMRTGQKSLLGHFGQRDGENAVPGLEMLEILSDDEADAKFGVNKAHQPSLTASQTRAVTSTASKVTASRKIGKLKETVIDVGTSGDVAEVGKRIKSYDVQGVITKGTHSVAVGSKLSGSKDKEEQRVPGTKESRDPSAPNPHTQSPIPVIQVECVDEIDRSLLPGSRSPRSPRSPRQARRVSPIASVSTSGKRSVHQDFPPPITSGLPHTEISLSIEKDKTTNMVRAVSADRSHRQSPSQTDIHYVTETDNQYASPKIRSKTGSPKSDFGEGSSRSKSPKRGEVRSRGKSPGTRVKGHPSSAETEIEMLSLWKDEDWRKKLATPEFKLQMFQRTSQDPHPSTPLLRKYHGEDSTLGAANNPAFVPETPPNAAGDGSTPSGTVHASKRGRKLNTGSKVLDSSMPSSRDEIKSSSITRLNQSTL